MNSIPKIGEVFLHRRVINDDLTLMKYRVTRVVHGWVYYKPLDKGHSEMCPVEDFCTKVSK